MSTSSLSPASRQNVQLPSSPQNPSSEEVSKPTHSQSFQKAVSVLSGRRYKRLQLQKNLELLSSIKSSELYKRLSSSPMIWLCENQSRLSKELFKNVPDVAMDHYIVSNGSYLGTSGVGPCFAICSIGKTSSGTPVLGLCHRQSAPCTFVVQKLKAEMVKQEHALPDTIKTYIVGGEAPSKESPEGGLGEEQEFLKISEAEKIEGVKFNQTTPEEEIALSVVVTPQRVVVSTNDLFPVTGKEDGTPICEDVEESSEEEDVEGSQATPDDATHPLNDLPPSTKKDEETNFEDKALLKESP